MHSVHVLYCLQSGSVEPREKDKPQLNKDTKKWNVSPAPKLKKQKVKKRKSNNKRASFFITEGTLLNNVWTVTSCNFIRQRKMSAKKVSIRYFKTCPMRICRLRIENWTKWKIIYTDNSYSKSSLKSILLRLHGLVFFSLEVIVSLLSL